MQQAAVHSAAAMLSEAHGLLLKGWSRGAQARDGSGREVPAWSGDAASWSLLGALLASWNRQARDISVVGHSLDARALGDATEALGEATGTAALDRWNDAEGRSRDDVIAAVERALELVES